MVWEIAGSGHLDALLVAFITLALLAHRKGRESVTGVLLASAVLVKLFPLVLFPALYRRWSWRMPLAFCVTFLVTYVPYLSVGARRVLGFLPAYTDEEGLQSGARFFLLQLADSLFGETRVPSTAYIVFALLVLGALALWSLFGHDVDGREDAWRAGLLAMMFTVLLSPHYTWYFVWLVPFLPIMPAKIFVPLLYLTVSSFMLYGTWLGDQPAQMLRLNASIYVPFALLFFLSYGRRGTTKIYNLIMTR
jgi:hypothetical protein